VGTRRLRDPAVVERGAFVRIDSTDRMPEDTVDEILRRWDDALVRDD
jgi:hypothetical protein